MIRHFWTEITTLNLSVVTNIFQSRGSGFRLGLEDLPSSVFLYGSRVLLRSGVNSSINVGWMTVQDVIKTRGWQGRMGEQVGLSLLVNHERHHHQLFAFDPQQHLYKCLPSIGHWLTSCPFNMKQYEYSSYWGLVVLHPGQGGGVQPAV